MSKPIASILDWFANYWSEQYERRRREIGDNRVLQYLP